jgi:hypothetical protein
MIWTIIYLQKSAIYRDQRDSSINKAVGTGQVCETYIDPGSSIVKSFTTQEQGNRSTQESAVSQIVTWKALDLGNVDPRLKTPVVLRQFTGPPLANNYEYNKY